MKMLNKDLTLKALKAKLREAQEAKNEQMAAITQACYTIIAGMPEQEVSEGICCGECYWYSKTTRHCTHKNGLAGRIRPKMYCSYGSYHHEMEDDEEDDFSEFEEGEDASPDD